MIIKFFQNMKYPSVWTSAGEAMREKEISIAHLYASPSLRCVESAKNLLEGELLCFSWQAKHAIAWKIWLLTSSYE